MDCFCQMIYIMQIIASSQHGNQVKLIGDIWDRFQCFCAFHHNHNI